MKARDVIAVPDLASLTAEDRKFLQCLKSDGAPTGGWDIPPASRAQDKARTRAKKRGWAAFDRKVWAWRLLPAGLATLRAKESNHG